MEKPESGSGFSLEGEANRRLQISQFNRTFIIMYIFLIITTK